MSIRPGITDNAAIAFKNEEDILSQFDDSESAYINEILPKKIMLYKKYVKQQSLFNDILLILKTIFKKWMLWLFRSSHFEYQQPI